jgi:hypothetical protein
MSKSPTMNLAAGTGEDDRAWVSDEDAPHWHLRLLLPPGAVPDTIPKDLQGLIASLFDAIMHRRRAMSLQPPVSSLRWRASSGNTHIRAVPGYWKELQTILERFWGTRLRLELAAPDALPRISFETSTPADDHGDFHARATAPPAPPVTVVAFTPDIDSLAAMSRILDTEQEPPVLVMCDAIAEHQVTSQEGFTGLIEACRSSIATITVHAPRRQQQMGDAAMVAFPEDWRLLHVLAAVSVALACNIDEIQVPQNGVANLNLPVTAAAISRPAHPIDPELASSLSRLLSHMAGSNIRIRNPLLADTPAELVADLIERGPRRLDMDIDAICGLVQNDNTYEARVDHNVSILGALHAGSSLAEQYERMLMPDLLQPANQGLADTYVRSIRELPVMSDRDVLSHLNENAAGASAGRDRHALAIGLLRRHAESVRYVLARAMQRYAHDIVAGTLASTCLLMRATLPGDLRPEASNTRKPMFRKLGNVPDCWEIWFEGGEPLYLKGSKGLDYIHALLQSPGSTFSPAELRDAIAGHGRMPTGNLGPVADAQAIRRYQQRLTDLRADLDVATEHNDIGRMDKIMHEIDALEQELSRCLGLGGRLRQNSDAERARKSVSNAMYRTLHQLRTRHPALSRHLSATLKIGNGVSYLPPDDIDWET